jgi:hypothetical protein
LHWPLLTVNISNKVDLGCQGLRKITLVVKEALE